MQTIFGDSRVLKLFSGQLLAQVCDRMTTLGLVWFLANESGTHAIAWFLAVSGLPHLLLNKVAPLYIQSWGLLRTTYIMDFLRAILFIVAAFCWQGLGSLQIEALFAIVFISNVAAAFFNPALLSLPVTLFDSEKVQSVTGLLNSCFSLALVLGPLVAIPLADRAGIEGVFVLTAVAYLVSGLFTLSVRNSTQNAQDQTGGEVASSLPLSRLAKEQSLVFALLVTFLFINIFLGPMQLAFPDFARHRFGGSINALALQEGAMGLGMLIGSFGIVLIKIKTSRTRTLLALLWIMCASFYCFYISSTLAFACLNLFVYGFALGVLNVISLEIFQLKPRSKDIPRVMSLVNLISVATLPVSMSLCGIALQNLSIDTLLLTSVISFVAVNVFVSILFLGGSKEYAF